MSRSARAFVAAVITSLVILSPSAALFAQKAPKLKGTDAPAKTQGSQQSGKGKGGAVGGGKDISGVINGQHGDPSESKVGRKPVEGRFTKARTFNGDIRSLPQTKPVERDWNEPEEPESHPALAPGTVASAEAVAPAAQAATVTSAPAPTPLDVYEGLDRFNWGSGSPPDTNGDAGPVYYIQTVNSSIGIFRKSDGFREAAFTFDTFMSQGHFGNLCDAHNFGDPVVLYDTFEDRWIVTDFAFKTDSGGNVLAPAFQCVAASKTGDPVTGGWNFYSTQFTDFLGDYPKLGIWPDGLYMSANLYSFGAGATFKNVRVFAFNKAQMYAGSPTVQIVSFDVGGGDFTVLPGNARLQTGTPPAGRPNLFMSTQLFLNAVTVYKFHADWDRISLSTFTGPDVPISATSWPTFAAAVPQPGTGQTLDSLSNRAMVQNQYTNFGGTESLWVSHTVRRQNTSGFAAPRWYQVNVTGGTVAASIPQAATWDPDAANVIHRWMPSLALDRAGDMAMGYSTSNSTTEFPSIKYAGRLAADPVNTFSKTEQTFFTGTASQLSSVRWGDYSAMTLDPDGCTFWYTTEYATGLDNTTADPTSFNKRWATKFGNFRYAECTPVGAGGTVSGTVTDGATSNPLVGATVALGSRTTTTDAGGAYSFTSIPAGTYPVITATLAGYGSASSTTIPVTDAGTTTRNFALTASPANSCPTDTTQADFQLGVPTAGLDLNTSPGDVTLSNAPAVDQQNTAGTTTGTSFGTPSWTGQTFIPAVTGTLAKADVQLFCNGCGATPPNLTLSVRATSSGLPTGADLATATIPGSAFASGSTVLYTASFGSPATLTSGTQYALVLRPVSAPAGSGYFWIRSSPSTYANGSRVISGDSGSTWSADTTRDFNFKTYMVTGYAASGNLVSGIKDANPAPGTVPTWTTLSWTATTPANTTLKFQAAASNNPGGPFNFVGPDGTASTFFTTSGSSLSQFDGFRYLEYKAFLSTTDTNVTPTMSDVTACFADVPETVAALDGQGVEPPSATSTLVFTVTLSRPAFSPISVDYATADQAAGAGHATGGASCDGTNDYLSTNGTLSFAAGEQIKAVTVTVCADSVPSEPDETFLLNLSNASGATVTNSPATGTIRQVNVAGTLLVSELRESGPAGAGDDFIELYNNSDSPLTVSDGTGILDAAHGYGVFKTGTTCGAQPALIAVVPNGTNIPARGHYLIAGTAYSLGSSAAGDKTLGADLENDRNLAVFSTTDPAQLSILTRLDAVGFSANTGGLCDLLGEGSGLASAAGSTSEYSFFRKLATGFPQDTNNNASDFQLVSTTPAATVGSTSSPALGAPGPENSSSPVNRTGAIKSTLLDPAGSVNTPPNRERDSTAGSCGTATPTGNCAAGTLTIRRTFTNNTGTTVTKLRFRVVDVTTLNSPGYSVGGGQADLRLLSSSLVTINGIDVEPMTVEPPTQANGGGHNSTIVATLPGGSLIPGGSVSVQFTLGVQQTGSFRFFVVVEAVP